MYAPLWSYCKSLLIGAWSKCVKHVYVKDYQRTLTAVLAWSMLHGQKRAEQSDYACENVVVFWCCCVFLNVIVFFWCCCDFWNIGVFSFDAVVFFFVILLSFLLMSCFFFFKYCRVFFWCRCDFWNVVAFSFDAVVYFWNILFSEMLLCYFSSLYLIVAVAVFFSHV